MKNKNQCSAVLWHGIGKKLRTKCQIKGKHNHHFTIYGNPPQYAGWTGQKAVTAFYDEPPQMVRDRAFDRY